MHGGAAAQVALRALRAGLPPLLRARGRALLRGRAATGRQLRRRAAGRPTRPLHLRAGLPHHAAAGGGRVPRLRLRCLPR
eukprot:scaffold4942_cov42-Phaeocystis_antarctica.AAC.1